MTGRGLSEFEEMKLAYLAIKDVDKVINSDSESKLEDAWNVISEIGVDKFDEVNTNLILGSIKDALMRIYLEKEQTLNDSINV